MTTTDISKPHSDSPTQRVLDVCPPAQGRVRKVLGQLLAPVLILAGGGALWVYTTGGFAKDERDTLPVESLTAHAAASQMMVTAEPVTFRPVQRVVEAIGTLYGYEEIVISAKVEGRVLRICQEVADRVPPDELLVEIDPTDYRLTVEQAENNLQVELAKLGLELPPDASFDLSKVPTVMLAQARMENAQSKLERNKRLAAENAASKGDLENAVSEFRTAQADHANQLLLAKSGLATIKLRQSALAISQQQLADTRILVPRPHRPVPGTSAVSYVITQRAVAEGTFVRAGGELCRLAIDQTLKLRMPITERYSAQITLGQRADVFTAAFAEAFSGTVTLINPTVDPSTRAFEVEIQIDNERGQLKPGSFAKAIIHTSQTNETPTVPLSALVTFAGVTKLFLAEDGRAKEVLVTPGVQTREWVEISQPSLAQGALVITSGQSLLADETGVTIRESNVPTASATPRAASRDSSAVSHGSHQR